MIGMKATFGDANLFRNLLMAISRFTDVIRFNVDSNKIGIRGIDPHGFLYFDIIMPKDFFSEYDINEEKSYDMKIDRLKNVLPKISKADNITLIFSDLGITISANKGWDMTFEFIGLEEIPFDFPKMKPQDYQFKITIDADEFSKLVQTASTISSELKFEFDNGVFSVKSVTKKLIFTGKPSRIINFEGNGRRVESIVIAQYLGFLASLINKSENITIFLSEQQPVKIDLSYKGDAVFSFYFTQKKIKTIKLRPRQSSSLPELTVSKFPEFLMYLAGFPLGIKKSDLVIQGMETENEDFIQMAMKLDFLERNDGVISLSNEGTNFINVLKNNVSQSKKQLNNLALSKIPVYEKIIKYVNDNSFAPNELYNRIKEEENDKKHDLTIQEFNNYLGLATWCDVVDNKLALIVIKK